MKEFTMKKSTIKESHCPRQAERSLPGPGSFDLAPRKVLVRSTSRYAPCTGPDKRGSPVHGMREERRSFIPTKGVCTGKSFVYIEQIRNLLSFARARVFRKGQVQNLCSPVQSNPVPQKVHESHFRRVSHAVFSPPQSAAASARRRFVVDLRDGFTKRGAYHLQERERQGQHPHERPTDMAGVRGMKITDPSAPPRSSLLSRRSYGSPPPRRSSYPRPPPEDR